jgi:transposase, IS5 family
MNKQQSFFTIGINQKKVRAERFLDEMQEVIPWNEYLKELNPYYKESPIGRNKTSLLLMLKIYFLQQWYDMSDPEAEDSIRDRISFQKFLDIDLLADNIPDETTILNFRHFLEDNELTENIFEATNQILEEAGILIKKGTNVDATILQAPSSTKNESKKRDPEMSSTKKGANYYFGMKAHIGSDMQSGVVHSAKFTTAKDSDISQMDNLLHGNEQAVGGDKGYYDEKKKLEFRQNGIQVMILDKNKRNRKLSNRQKKRNYKKSKTRAIVEHPFQVIKHQWKHRKVRYKGIFKNACQFYTLFALSNIFKVRKQLLVS